MSLDCLENNIEAERSDTHPEDQAVVCDPKEDCYHSLNSIFDDDVIDIDCLPDADAEARALICDPNENTYVSTLINVGQRLIE